MRYPAAVPAVALLVGVTTGVFLPAPALAPSPGLLRVLLVVGWAGSLMAFLRHRTTVLTLCLLVAFGSSGWALASKASAGALSSPLRQWFDREKARSAERDVLAIVEGILREDAARRPWGASLNLRVERIVVRGEQTATSGGLRASVTGSLVSAHVSDWRAGRRVRLPVTLRPPSYYLNPGVSDEEARLAWRGTALVGSVKSAALVELLESGSWPEERAAAIRHEVRLRLQQSVARWDQQSAAIITALLIGDRAGLDDAIERRLQEAGTYHVIAISGGNIAILAALTFGLLRCLRVSPRIATGATMVLLIAYGWLVGAQSSVSRATLMALSYLAARLLDHRTDPMNAMAVAMVVVLSASPLSIADVGFTLTFGATMAILIGAGRWRRSLPTRAWLAAPALLLVASVSVEIALFPVSAFVFSRVTFAGLVLNFLAVPLMAVAQVAGLAAVTLSTLSASPAAAAGWLAHLAAWGLAESAKLVELVPWVSYRLPPPAPLAIVVYYLALGGWLLAATDRAQARWPQGGAVTLRRLTASVTTVAALWILVEPVSASSHLLDRGGTLRITFLDVGQGDSTFVQFPGGHSLLVDAGGGTETFDLGARIIAPALWARGVRRLDTLAITHGDPDHIGGAPSVLRDFSPRDVWDGVPVPPHEPTKTLREFTEAHGVVWRTLQRGDHLRIGGAEVHLWHPPPPDWERQDVRNDDSLVLEIRYGEVSIVLPGDIGRDIERTLAPQFAPAGLRILKAAHHGSNTSSSSEFLDALRPAIVVFSCGRDNAYGHPTSQVLRRVQQIGATGLRTDRDGAISMETDGQRVRIRTHAGKELTRVVSK